MKNRIKALSALLLCSLLISQMFSCGKNDPSENADVQNNAENAENTENAENADGKEEIPEKRTDDTDMSQTLFENGCIMIDGLSYFLPCSCGVLLDDGYTPVGIGIDDELPENGYVVFENGSGTIACDLFIESDSAKLRDCFVEGILVTESPVTFEDMNGVAPECEYIGEITLAGGYTVGKTKIDEIDKAEGTPEKRSMYSEHSINCYSRGDFDYSVFFDNASQCVIGACVARRIDKDMIGGGSDKDSELSDKDEIAQGSAEKENSGYTPLESLPSVNKTAADSKLVMNIGGIDISLAEYRLYFMNLATAYARSSLLDSAENREMTEQGILDLLIENKSYEICARNNGTVLSEFYKKEFDDEILRTINSYEGGYFDALEEFYFTDKVYRDTMYANYLATQVYSDKYAGRQIPDEEILAYAKEHYVRVKHILISTVDKDETENSALREQAYSVLEKAKNGENFEDLILEYSSDGMDVDTGYYFTSGTMVQEFENAAFELEENEISGLVETAYGYHIIKRYPFDNEFILSDENTLRDEIAREITTEDFVADLKVLAEDIEVTYSDDFEEVKEKLYNEAKDIINAKAENAQ